MGVSSIVAFSSSISRFSFATAACTFCLISFVFARSSSLDSARIAGSSAFTSSTIGEINFISRDALLPNSDCITFTMLILLFVLKNP